MDMNINANAAAQRSVFVAPTPVTFRAFGDAGMATGHRTWRHLIT